MENRTAFPLAGFLEQWIRLRRYPRYVILIAAMGGRAMYL